jgi:hypothetical protein
MITLITLVLDDGITNIAKTGLVMFIAVED